MQKENQEEKHSILTEKAAEIRNKVLDYHSFTKTSHIGGSLSCVEVLVALYYEIMNKNDSFILSKGHSSSTLYVVLHDLGRIPEDQLYALEQHPTLNKDIGIEATTGSLGHGLSIGLGIALADPNKKSFVLMSDGECDEGQVWEAARLASQLQVKNLITIVDCNGWQAFKRADYLDLDKKFTAFGWDVVWCDGHNIKEILSCLKKNPEKPLAILAKTIKGKGIKQIEDSLESHYFKCGKKE